MPDNDSPSQVQIELNRVSKHYDGVIGAETIDLSICKGEFFSLLGPSGCGKSTILKLIAGFEDPTVGELFIAGRAMSGIPPERRNVGFVFQNYALFPHMNVFENVAFGLRARRLGAVEIGRRVERALELVELPDLGLRRANQLSGGQQQRVALARAVVIEPEVLLLDEPLGALDKKLREAMQIKLVELQETLGVTTVFVTHDQEEALTMSDRIGVMSVQRHSIEQIGTPREIYERPASLRVSSFIGQTNLWEERIVAIFEDGHARTERGFRLAIRQPMVIGETVVVSVRPERIRLLPPSSEPGSEFNCMTGRVQDVIFLGETILYLVEAETGFTIQVKTLNSDASMAFGRGHVVTLAWQLDSMLSLPRDSKKRGEA